MISHFIVLTTYGQIFFSKEFGEESGVDVALTGGLISAVYSMTSETQREKITEMALEDKKILFRERESDLLFVLTVDELMDDTDANDLLDEIADSFFQKYGELKIDGMILSDFEPIIDEIVQRRLWYTTTQEVANKKWDFLATSSIALIVAWLTALFIKVGYAFEDGFTMGGIFFPSLIPSNQDFLNGALNMVYATIYYSLFLSVPLLLGKFLYDRAPGLRATYRFALEFFQRPTRSGYSSFLPKWFLLPLVNLFVLVLSISYFGRVMIWELQALQISNGLLRQLNAINAPWINWMLLLLITVFTFGSWIFLQPLFMTITVGAIRRTYQFDKRFYRDAVLVATLSSYFLLPYIFWASLPFQELLGFHPNDIGLLNFERTTLKFLLITTLPLNIFLFGFLFYLGVGLSRLVKMDRLTYAVSFALSAFTTILLQKLIFWIIFQSGLVYIGVI